MFTLLPLFKENFLRRGFPFRVSEIGLTGCEMWWSSSKQLLWRKYAYLTEVFVGLDNGTLVDRCKTISLKHIWFVRACTLEISNEIYKDMYLKRRLNYPNDALQTWSQEFADSFFVGLLGTYSIENWIHTGNCYTRAWGYQVHRFYQIQLVMSRKSVIATVWSISVIWTTMIPSSIKCCVWWCFVFLIHYISAGCERNFLWQTFLSTQPLYKNIRVMHQPHSSTNGVLYSRKSCLTKISLGHSVIFIFVIILRFCVSEPNKCICMYCATVCVIGQMRWQFYSN